MRRLFTLIIALLITCSVFSQGVADHTYWFYFTDKENNVYDISDPQAFLSTRSIERRAWQSLVIDETDLPVTQLYVDSLAKLNLEIKHISKWLNGVLVISTDDELIDTLANISFISKAAWQAIPDVIYTPGIPTQERFEPAADPPPSYNYGYAKNQVSQVGTDALHLLGYTGAGVHITVIDIGFRNMPSLPAFQKSYAEGLVLAERNFVDRSVDAYENYNHGTNVASIIAANWTDTLVGTAPDATLILELKDAILPLLSTAPTVRISLASAGAAM